MKISLKAHLQITQKFQDGSDCKELIIHTKYCVTVDIVLEQLQEAILASSKIQAATQAHANQ